MKRELNFTEGKILGPLMLFAGPIFLAHVLQSMYGAVDLLIVGKFAVSADVSAVSTGAQTMMSMTNLVAGISMGTTVLLGQRIGEGKKEEAGKLMGASIYMFLVLGLIASVLSVIFSKAVAGVLNAPVEAFEQTVSYMRICGAGMVVIVAYNLVGSIFRGIGDSNTPLIAVAIACVCNILGDLLLVGVFHMGASGAAIATVAAQMISVILSLMIAGKRGLPFAFSRSFIRYDKVLIRQVFGLGFPIALQSMLANISFLIILSIVNSLGLVVSAGVGVAERICGFVMLVPDSFGSAMASFVAQNYGAGKMDRARKALLYSILVSLGIGLVMFSLNFFRGELLTGIFSNDPEVIAAAADYLKAYALDCLMTAFLFNFMGYFNGIGMTRFNMVQGITGAFCVRTPLSYLFSRYKPVSLVRVGLAIPLSTFVQNIMCVFAYRYSLKRGKKAEEKA